MDRSPSTTSRWSRRSRIRCIPNQSESPVAFLYDKAGGRENRFGTVKDYPYVATSYRLTEHEHYVTQHVPASGRTAAGAVRRDAGGAGPGEEHPDRRPRPRQLQARQARGAGGRDQAAGRPCEVDGKKVYHIGIPIHWGFVGIAADRDPTKGANWLANALTPFVGDANSRTPEFKAFLVNIEKV